jgi:nucleoside-diphosphate-sugar epimerase
MQVFVTGATGFIGSRIVAELLEAKHGVLGLTRSDSGARALTAAGAEVHRGDIDDLESLRAGAARSDAVIHTAFNHDFSQFVANCEADRRVIEAMGAVLAGSRRPLIITSGTGMGSNGPGQTATEDNINKDNPNPRVASELAGLAVAARGVDVRVVRLPQVHDPLKQGLITEVVRLAREKRVSAFAGEGKNRWPAAHVADAAHLYRLVLEQGEANCRYHAVAEEGIPLRQIAETIAASLHVPVRGLSADEAKSHFGWLGMFISHDMPASSALTRARLGWQPSGPDLITDLRRLSQT